MLKLLRLINSFYFYGKLKLNLYIQKFELIYENLLFY